MSNAAFTKGQKVNVFFGHRDTVTVTFQTYTVASCGAKRMHLLRADGSNAEWRTSMDFFRQPSQGHDVQDVSVEPVAHCAALRLELAKTIRAHFADRTRTALDGLTRGDNGAQGYANSIAAGRQAFEAATADLVF